MSYRLGVDLGTTFTAAAVWDGSSSSVLALGNRALQIPSVLFLKDDGEFLVGEAAERRGVAEPERLVREFKRRIGDSVPMYVAGSPFSPQALTAHLLRWVCARADERLGGPPDEVVLTHPANWGPFKLDLLRQVVTLADVGAARFCPEPEAAAAQYAAQSRVAPGERVAVYDLGGGTFDVCVLEQTTAGFALLGAPEGVEHLGGIDFDRALFEQVVAGLEDALAGLDPDDPAVTLGLARLRRDCVEAKEALSSDTDATVAVSFPGYTSTVRVTRAELETMIRPPLRETVDAVRRALRSAGVTAEQLHAILLVGGSSRIPLVTEVLQQEFPVRIALDTHPKHDVALGAVLVGTSRTSVPAAPATKSGPSASTASTAATGSTGAAALPAAGLPGATAPARGRTAKLFGRKRAAAAAAGGAVAAGGAATGPAAATGSAAAGDGAPAGASAAPDGAVAGGGAGSTPAAIPPGELPGRADRGAAAAGSVGADSPSPRAPDPGPAESRSKAPSRANQPSPKGPAEGPKDRDLNALAPTVGAGGAAGTPLLRRRSLQVAAAVTAVAVGTTLALVLRDPGTASPGALPGSVAPSSSASAPSSSAATATPPAAVDIPRSASPLPDRVMVWPRTKDDNYDIALVDDQGNEGAVLTSSPETDSFPVLSPDRRSVIYGHQGASGGVLHVVGADGKGDRPLFARLPTGCEGLGRPDWSSKDLLAVMCGGAQAGKFGRLVLVTLDGKLVRELDSGKRMGDPTFTPDGSQVIYYRNDHGDPDAALDGGALYRVPTDGSGGPVRLTDGGNGTDADPSCSPTGSKIAFRRHTGGQRSIVIVDFDGTKVTSEPRRVTPGPRDQDPSWSPSERAIAYKSGSDLDGDLSVVDLDTGTSRRVTDNDEPETAPAWT